jgi:hypothetical protein
MLRHRPYLGLPERHPLCLIHGHRTIGEEVVHQASLEFSGSLYDLLSGLSGFLDSTEYISYCLLFWKRRHWYW